VVPRRSKVICVGLNYRNHIEEMGRKLPEYPTLFAKFADALIGARDDIIRPEETGELGWEAELALVIGSPVRRAREAAAGQAITGFTLLNDVTCRDWQFRTGEWLQGKTWDSSTPVGPCLVTPDELPGGVRPALGLRLEVDGEMMQCAHRPLICCSTRSRWCNMCPRSCSSVPAMSSPPAPLRRRPRP
jgi:2-keto-4-pentenoate hydratase/2-oxohepta-3-ene-1,7-dioic acid hydratase in catechol pathway